MKAGVFCKRLRPSNARCSSLFVAICWENPNPAAAGLRQTDRRLKDLPFGSTVADLLKARLRPLNAEKPEQFMTGSVVFFFSVCSGCSSKNPSKRIVESSLPNFWLHCSCEFVLG